MWWSRRITSTNEPFLPRRNRLTSSGREAEDAEDDDDDDEEAPDANSCLLPP
jgi:hypothetical protein